MSECKFVCDADDLEDGDSVVVEVDDDPIGVVKYEGEFYALKNVCAHQGGPVCSGMVRGALVAEWPGPGKRVEEDLSNRPAISCPYHGWEYDLETGVHLGDPSVTLETYDVEVRDNEVYLILSDSSHG